jgi:hypothetical protein
MKTYFYSNFGKKCFSVATLLFFLLSQSAFAAVSVTNGNFADTGGMADVGGGWYDGTPNGWSTTGANQYVINNEVLNLDHVGVFSQILGVVDVGAEDITVSFEYGDIWNGGYYATNEDMITAEIFDTTAGGPPIATKTVTNTGSYGSFVTDSLSVTATAGHILQVRFTSLAGNGVTPGDAAALDNVSVTAIDATAPIITNVSSDKADGTYTIGEVIDIDVTFSENVSGTMALTLDSGGTCDITVTASNTGTCDYVVSATQNSLDLTLSSATGTVSDAAGNPMSNFVPSVNLAANKALIISTPVPPTLTEVTPVTTPTFDTTPTYVFHSTEAGTINYAGGCTSSTGVAVVGNNTVTFDSLAVGTYDCTITVTDIDTEFTDLAVTQFFISPVVPNTVVVNPLNPGSWGHAQETATGTGTYALTPSAPPLGSGAFQMDINASGGYYLGAALYSATPLTDITELSYSTYRASADGGNNLAIALQLNVDYDGTDATSTWQGRLVYEPYNTPGIGGTVMQDTWHNWNALTGRWWMTGNAIVSNVNVGKACTQWAPCTWSDLLFSYPNAAISSAVGFKAGSNWGPIGFSGFVDNFTIAIKDTGIDTTYNFEFDTTAPSAGEVTPVPAITNDEAPEYTFTTDEAGTITYGGSCTGSTTTATVGNNVISFDTLGDGTYSDCTITLTDIASNQITFPVTPFEIDTVVPTATVSYSITWPTNTDVIATITPTETVVVTNNGNQLTYTFTENGTFTFNFVDSAWNGGTSVATISYIDKVSPTITLWGSSYISLTQGNPYNEDGASCVDNVDVTCAVTVSGFVNTSIPGTYILTYSAIDSVGNSSNLIREVSVLPQWGGSVILPQIFIPITNSDPINQPQVPKWPTTPQTPTNTQNPDTPNTQNAPSTETTQNAPSTTPRTGQSSWNSGSGQGSSSSTPSTNSIQDSQEDSNTEEVLSIPPAVEEISDVEKDQATDDRGGGQPADDDKNTIAWFILWLLALLNIWWFAASRWKSNKGQ